MKAEVQDQVPVFGFLKLAQYLRKHVQCETTGSSAEGQVWQGRTTSQSSIVHRLVLYCTVLCCTVQCTRVATLTHQTSSPIRLHLEHCVYRPGWQSAMARSFRAKVAATLSIVHKGELHTLSLGTLPDSMDGQKMLALFK